jgi:hypothetical protein
LIPLAHTASDKPDDEPEHLELPWLVYYIARLSSYICLAMITFWAILLPTWPALLLLLWAHVHWFLPMRVYANTVPYLAVYITALAAFEFIVCIDHGVQGKPDWGIRIMSENNRFLELGARFAILIFIAISCRFRELMSTPISQNPSPSAEPEDASAKNDEGTVDDLKRPTWATVSSLTVQLAKAFVQNVYLVTFVFIYFAALERVNILNAGYLLFLMVSRFFCSGISFYCLSLAIAHVLWCLLSLISWKRGGWGVKYNYLKPSCA